jgi:hypothetical protein
MIPKIKENFLIKNLYDLGKNKISIGNMNTKIEEFDINYGENLCETLKNNFGEITSICYQKNGNVLTGTNNQGIDEWNMKTLTKLNSYSDPVEKVNKIIQLKDRKIVVGSNDKKVFIYDENKNLLKTIEDNSEILDVIELCDGELATVGKDNWVKFYKNCEIDRLLPLDMNVIKILQINHNQELVIILENEKKYHVRVLTFDTLECIEEFNEHTDEILNIIELDDERLLSVSLDGTVVIYNIIDLKVDCKFNMNDKKELANAGDLRSITIGSKKPNHLIKNINYLGKKNILVGNWYTTNERFNVNYANNLLNSINKDFGEVNTLCFQINGNVLTGSNQLDDWDINTLTKLNSYTEPKEKINKIIQTHDKKILVATNDKKIFVYNKYKNLLNTFDDNAEIVDIVELTDGNFATITKENSIKFYKNFQIEKSLPVELPPVRLLQCHKRDYIVVALDSENKHVVRILKKNELETVDEYSEHKATITNLAELVDGRIVSTSVDDTIVIYNIKKLCVECKFKVCENRIIAQLGDINIYTPGLPELNYLIQNIYLLSTNNIALGNLKTVCKKYNFNSECELLENLKKDFGEISSICILKNGNVVTGNNNNEIDVWNISDKLEKINTYNEPRDKIIKIIQSQNDNIVVATKDQKILFFNNEEKNLLNTIETDSEILDLIELINGTILTANSDNSLKFYVNNELEKQFPLDFKPQKLLQSHKNENLLFVVFNGKNNHIIRVYKIDTLEMEKELKEHDDTIINIVELNDGNIMSVSIDGLVNIYNIEDQTPIQKLNCCDDLDELREIKDICLYGCEEEKKEEIDENNEEEKEEEILPAEVSEQTEIIS